MIVGVPKALVELKPDKVRLASATTLTEPKAEVALKPVKVTGIG
jgi:hypothetical protein